MTHVVGVGQTNHARIKWVLMFKWEKNDFRDVAVDVTTRIID